METGEYNILYTVTIYLQTYIYPEGEHILYMMIDVDKLMEMGLLSGLLRLAWTAGILPILIALIPSSSLHSFRNIISGFAQRGKIMQSSITVSIYIYVHLCVSLSLFLFATHFDLK